MSFLKFLDYLSCLLLTRGVSHVLDDFTLDKSSEGSIRVRTATMKEHESFGGFIKSFEVQGFYLDKHLIF